MGGGKRKPPEVKIAVGRGTAIAEAVDSLSAAPTTSTTGANRLSRPSATPLLPPSLVLDPSLKATTTTVSSQVEGNSIATTANVENFRKAASGYLNDDRFSDLIIICKGKEFKVHRCFVCAHSKWFERCCSGEFLKAQSPKIELEDNVLTAVERMITFFYTWDYDDTMSSEVKSEPDSKEPSSDLQLNAWMYAIAEKYEVPDLETMSLQKFKNAAARVLTNVDVPALLDAVRTLYKYISLPESDTKLRDILLDTWVLASNELKTAQARPLIVSLFSELPEFALDVTQHSTNG